MQEKLDAVRDASSGPYVVDGRIVHARPMFRMNGGINDHAMKEHAREVDAIAKTGGPAARFGRPTPAGLVHVTQALIDAGKLAPPPPGSIETRIRRMQWEYGIGVDCAGYVAQAATAVHGAASTKALRDNDNSWGALDRGEQPLRRVSIAGARTGDVMHLASKTREPGHNVIVYSHATQASPPPGMRGMPGTGPFHVFEVDSSWGAGYGNDYGGYRRDTWIYDESTEKWGFRDPASGRFEVADGPKDETFAGAFRPASGA